MIEWEKQFPIVSINRADLTEFGFTDEYIATVFTDEVMTEVAATMEESYHMNYGFWEDFRRAIRTVLREQNVQTTGEQSETEQIS